MTTIADLAPGLSKIKTSLEADALRAEIRDLTDKLAKARRHLKAEKSHSKRLRRRLNQIATNNQEDNTMNTNETTNNDQIQEDTMTDTETAKAAPAEQEQDARTPEQDQGKKLPPVSALFRPYAEHAPETDLPDDSWTDVVKDGRRVVMHADSPTGNGWTAWSEFEEGEGFLVAVDTGAGPVMRGKLEIAVAADVADRNHETLLRDWLDDVVAIAGYLESSHAKTADALGESDAKTARERYDTPHEAKKVDTEKVYAEHMKKQEDRARKGRADAADRRLTGDPVRRETMDLLRDIAHGVTRIADALEKEGSNDD